MLQLQRHQQQVTIDHSGIAKLYQQYSGALYGFILQFTNDVEIASAILEESFVRIYQQYQDYDSSKMSLFIFMKQITRTTISERLCDLLPAHASALPNHVFLKTIEANCSPLQHQIFFLQYCKGYTTDQVAMEVGLTVSAVKEHLREAVLALNNKL